MKTLYIFALLCCSVLAAVEGDGIPRWQWETRFRGQVFKFVVSPNDCFGWDVGKPAVDLESALLAAKRGLADIHGINDERVLLSIELKQLSAPSGHWIYIVSFGRPGSTGAGGFQAPIRIAVGKGGQPIKAATVENIKSPDVNKVTE
jgi:hypothetical protein